MEPRQSSPTPGLSTKEEESSLHPMGSQSRRRHLAARFEPLIQARRFEGSNILMMVSWTLPGVRNSKTFRILEPFPSSGERRGTYSVGSLGKSKAQSLDLYIFAFPMQVPRTSWPYQRSPMVHGECRAGPRLWPQLATVQVCTTTHRQTL
jgi:hypothetical protein